MFISDNPTRVTVLLNGTNESEDYGVPGIYDQGSLLQNSKYAKISGGRPGWHHLTQAISILYNGRD